MSSGAAVPLALGAAVFLAVGAVLQQRAAAQAPSAGTASLRLIGRLARRPLWLAGVVVGFAQFGLQAAALGKGSLVVVEPLLVTGLLFALPMAATWLRQRLSARDWLAAIATVGGLATFLVVAAPGGGRDEPTGAGAAAGATVVAAVVLVAVLLATRLRRPSAKALLLGVAAGVDFGLTDAMTKATVSALADRHAAVFLGWQPWLLAVAGLTGFVLVQNAYHAAHLAASMPAVSVLEPVTGSLLGVAIFGERIHGSGPSTYLTALALLAMFWGVSQLARSPLVTRGAGAAAGTAAAGPITTAEPVPAVVAGEPSVPTDQKTGSPAARRSRSSRTIRWWW